MNVVELLEQTLSANAERAAFIDGPCGHEHVMTYGAFASASRRLASLFAQMGLAPGSGVVVMLPMSAQLYTVIIAAWRVGLVPVFIDPHAGEERFAHCLSRYPVRAFVGTTAACLLRLGSRTLRAIPRVLVAGAFFPGARSLRAACSMPEHGACHPCGDEAPAMLAFTSGTTGWPKGMMRTHGLLREMHGVLSAHLAAAPGEVTLATMPLFTLTYLACGVTSLIPDVDLRHPGQVEPERLLEQLTRWEVGSGVASPALVERLADHCLARGERLATLRKLYVGGAPVLPRLLDKMARVAPAAEVVVLYGSTEAEPIALISHRAVSTADVAQMNQGRGLLVGRAIAAIKLRILHDRWGSARPPMSTQALEEETLGAGAVGEIVVAGVHVAPGYLDKEDERNIKFQVGNEIWHRTGDAGWLDEQGRLWLVGRCAARIDDAHGRIYPYTVEAALASFPAIARSALLLHEGVRVLVLEITAGAPPDIARWLEPLGWAHIDSVVVVKELPVDARHNAKVDYRQVRTLLAKRRWLRRIERQSWSIRK